MILFHPLAFKAKPYQLELLKWRNGGFPVIFSTEESQKGFICVKGKSENDILKIAMVISRQLQNRSTDGRVRIFTGKLDYPKDYAKDLKIPFLLPSCSGHEERLIECKQYGLGVAIPESCHEGSDRLFIIHVANDLELNLPFNGFHLLNLTFNGFNPPPYLFYFSKTAMTFSAAKNFCQSISPVYIGGLESSQGNHSASIDSHIWPEGINDLKFISNGHWNLISMDTIWSIHGN